MERRGLDRGRLVAAAQKPIARETLTEEGQKNVEWYTARWARWAFERNVFDLPWSAELTCEWLVDEADEGHTWSTLRTFVAYHARWHLEGGHEPPTSSPAVRRLMGLLRREVGTGALFQRRALYLWELAAIFQRSILAYQGKHPLHAARDWAIIALGSAGGARAGELAAARLADLRFTADGIAWRLPRTKTAKSKQKAIPFNRHQPELCPVEAVRRWLDLGRVRDGYLFRPLPHQSQMALGPLSYSGLRRLFLWHAERAGLEQRQLGLHSLRVGIVVEGTRAGVVPAQLRRITSHDSDQMIAHYARDEGGFDEHPMPVIWRHEARRRRKR